MYEKELTINEIEALWGGELPELEEEYRELAEVFPTGRKELAPYIMKSIYSLLQAKLALCLPCTSAQAAEKIGISESEAEEMLFEMAKRGMVMKTADGYDRIKTLAFLKDYYYANPKYDCEKNQRTARLMLNWDAYVEGRCLPDKTFRIIPKWQSIKNIPGVMPCENMPQMLLDCLPDRIAFVRCPCRAVTSIAETGEYHPENFRGDTGETKEQKDGLCIIVGPRASYFAKMYDGYVPTKEELLEKTAHIESNGTYYTANNLRVLGVMCNCGDDCGCGMRVAYEAGDDEFFSKSRFVAYAAKPEKCVGCGMCENACMFHKSVKVVDGKACVDEKSCHGCGVCTVKCPQGVLKMKLVRPASHIPGPKL